MKKTLAVFLISVLFAMTGCSDSLTGDSNIMRPPRPTGDKAVIQDVLTKLAGGDFDLKYPQNGEYSSAIIMRDITGSGENDAVALYVPDGNTNGICVSFISDVDGTWKSIGDFSVAADGIDRVMFADITGDGSEEILIGWTNKNSSVNMLTSYACEKDTVREMTIDDTYNDICLTDITDDGVTDIILLSLALKDTPASAKLLQYSEKEMRPTGKFAVELDSDIVRYSNILSGNISKNTKGIFIDGEKSGNVWTTEVLYWSKSDSSLVNPMYSKGQDIINQTTRNLSVQSQDIDNDGCVEMPVITALPAKIEDDFSTVCQMISWKNFQITDGTLTTKLNTVFNHVDNYYFAIPDSWNGSVTAKIDAGNHTMTFYAWDKETNIALESILTIYCMSEDEWEKAKQEEFVYLYGENSVVYVAKPTISEGRAYMKISNEEIIQGFSLIKKTKGGAI